MRWSEMTREAEVEAGEKVGMRGATGVVGGRVVIKRWSRTKSSAEESQL
jgi:hypothetical protein